MTCFRIRSSNSHDGGGNVGLVERRRLDGLLDWARLRGYRRPSSRWRRRRCRAAGAQPWLEAVIWRLVAVVSIGCTSRDRSHGQQTCCAPFSFAARDLSPRDRLLVANVRRRHGHLLRHTDETLWAQSA